MATLPPTTATFAPTSSAAAQPTRPADTAAAFCATLVDEWVRGGVRHAIIAPGSRSTPLAMALADRHELTVDVFHDERAASFAALGIGLSTNVPAVAICSSGTAAAHFHAAVIEAHQSCVPMIVCTADRPPELRGVGAPQTIDQTHLFGRSVRWFFEPGVADESQRGTWRSIASRALIDASGPLPGPVHLNLAFREPLLGSAGALPPARQHAWHTDAPSEPIPTEQAIADFSRLLHAGRGVIVAGRGVDDPAAVRRFASTLGWPVLADPRSGCRTPEDTTVAAYDSILRNLSFASSHQPAVVVHLGEPPASKVLSQWLVTSGARHVQIGAASTWIDPDHAVEMRITARPSRVLDSTVTSLRTTSLALAPADLDQTSWLVDWRRAEVSAQSTLDGLFGGDTACVEEPGIARAVYGSVPSGGSLVVSSSMPIRDVEWYGAPRCGLTVHSNRGANGIDGVISTAIGVAIGSGAPTVLLIGDVAFLHDSSALVALARREIDLTVVVVDNDGGGIFSFLPQGSSLRSDRFEQLFGTPHGTDLVALCRAHGLQASVVATYPAVRAAVSGGGLSIAVVQTNRNANVTAHDTVHAAVSMAMDDAGR